MRGWDELLDYLKNIFEIFNSRPTPIEIFDPGGSYFCVRIAYDIVGYGSGVALETETYNLYEVRRGICSRQWQARRLEDVERWLGERTADLAGA